MTKNLGAPAPMLAPPLAYGQHVGSTCDQLRPDTDYRAYKFLGRLSVIEFTDARDALAAARDKFGPRSKVFYATRYWVAYEIQ